MVSMTTVSMSRAQQAMAAARARVRLVPMGRTTVRTKSEHVFTNQPRPLEVSTLPLPGDVRIRVLMQPQAALGEIDVQVGLGQGSKGRGQRVGDDPAMHAAIAYRLAAHLSEYARSFSEAAAQEEPRWFERLTAAAEALDPLPADGWEEHCRECGARGTLASGLCPECHDLRESL